MKIGQLIEYMWWNNYGGKVDPDPFIKNRNWACLWSNRLKCYTVCFYWMFNSRSTKYIKTKVLTTCCDLIESFFKNRKGLDLDSRWWGSLTIVPAGNKAKCLSWVNHTAKAIHQSPCLNFCMIFEEKYFSCYILLTDQISLASCLYFLKYWATNVLQLFVAQSVMSQILNLSMAFLSIRFSVWAKSKDEKLIILTRRAFKMKHKAFFIIFKGFSAARPLNLEMANFFCPQKQHYY